MLGITQKHDIEICINFKTRKHDMTKVYVNVAMIKINVCGHCLHQKIFVEAASSRIDATFANKANSFRNHISNDSIFSFWEWSTYDWAFRLAIWKIVVFYRLSVASKQKSCFVNGSNSVAFMTRIVSGKVIVHSNEI